MMKNEFWNIAKNCIVCVAAGVTVSIAIKYLKDNDFSLQSLIDRSNLNSYERKILANSILPVDLEYSTQDVIGQKDLLDQIIKEVIYPFRFRDLYHKIDVELPKGLLLFGPPGCGKTMLAQAIAKELNVSFINIRLDVIQDKYFGETTKLVKAIFTLAKKIKPCVVFFDEIDSVISTRSSEDHEVTKGCKSAFLQFWDGVQSREQEGILIIGTTNRRDFLDDAFISRFDLNYFMPLPSERQREEFLKKALHNKTEPNFDFASLAKKTMNFSFRDLKIMCKLAKCERIPVQIDNYMKTNRDIDQIQPIEIKLSDFDQILTSKKFHYITQSS